MSAGSLLERLAGHDGYAADAFDPAPDVVVYVCGAVRSPGVVRVPAGARVTDALEVAGGPTAKAELAAVNLAATVADGQQIVVPEKGAGGQVAAAPASASAGSSGPRWTTRRRTGCTGCFSRLRR